MNVIIFIIILGILVFVHELGHFLFAKMFGIRVDEFGFGYPPRAWKIGRWRGTDITLNWIPFGGFVKIFGESDSGEELSDEEKKVSLIHKPRWQQFLVMFGGILFNIIFAWLLFSGLYMHGMQASVDSAPESYTFESTKLMVTEVLPGSPADTSGVVIGDEIKEYFSTSNHEPIRVTEETVVEISDFINRNAQAGFDTGFVVLRGENDVQAITMDPEQGLISDKYGVGVSIERVGTLKLPVVTSLWYGMKSVAYYSVEMLRGFWQLITGSISLDNVSGPVGIANQVSDTARLGFIYLVMFTALLSMNLAVLNFIPFPALDGGRILIILIESIVRKRLNPKIVNWINVGGFFLLIGLMLLVTVKDIIKLF